MSKKVPIITTDMNLGNDFAGKIAITPNQNISPNKIPTVSQPVFTPSSGGSSENGSTLIPGPPGPQGEKGEKSRFRPRCRREGDKRGISSTYQERKLTPCFKTRSQALVFTCFASELLPSVFRSSCWPLLLLSNPCRPSR